MNPYLRLLPLASLVISRLAEAADQTPAPSADTSLLGLLVPLIAVTIAIVALWWILRRNSGRSGTAGPARIVQVVAVGPRERVVIIDCESRRLVLGVTPTAISTLAELDPKDAAKIPPIASASLNENGPATRR